MLEDILTADTVELTPSSVTFEGVYLHRDFISRRKGEYLEKIFIDLDNMLYTIVTENETISGQYAFTSYDITGNH